MSEKIKNVEPESPKNGVNLLLRSMSDYLDRYDEYGDRRLLKFAVIVKWLLETTRCLGLDDFVALGLLYGSELMRLREDTILVDPLQNDPETAARVAPVRAILREILQEADPEETARILRGLDHLLPRTDETAEEKLAIMFMDAFAYADGLDTRDKRSICFINFKNRVMTYSRREGRLCGPVVPVLPNPRKKGGKPADVLRTYDD